MVTDELRELLRKFRDGRATENEILAAITAPPQVPLQFANVDTQRGLRNGFPEVIFGSGKSPQQVLAIAKTVLRYDSQLLVTRIDLPHAQALKRIFPDACYNALARTVVVEKKPLKKKPGLVAVVSAGTSDAPVAEEAAVTAETMGNKVLKISDVGVAGIHRILSRAPDLQTANVIIVVAGMEGALPSVVAGLVSKPVIAVPTSIGYGASFGGLAALLGMLNSCGSGVTVVNIDNGFGAGFAASQINALAAEAAKTRS